MFTIVRFLSILAAFFYTQLSASLVSTESDPDAFIQECVNVINGDYCETATDLIITGPDPLVLQRFYSQGWKFFPQRFLIMGKDPSGKSCIVGREQYDWTLAFTGERSGAVLPYCGWRKANNITRDPLKIDLLNAKGMVNTYAKEISGQTNHQNNRLYGKGDFCELLLGDGTKRIYRQVQGLPSCYFGEEITPLLAFQVLDPSYFLLTEEVLPSGNRIVFSYDEAGHLLAIEMKDSSLKKAFSWMHFAYEQAEKKYFVQVETSDARKITYEFDNDQLIKVEGTHCIPLSYEYKGQRVVKKNLPEGRFVEITYQDGKVKELKGPHAFTGKAEVAHRFSYGKEYTDVFDAGGIKTRYVYDSNFQLIAVEQYDEEDQIYRIDRKFWGTGLLLAKTISDSQGRVHSYRSFQYDKSGNVIEERLYGNLTGKQEASLQVSSAGKILHPDEEECHLKKFTYSTDGFNLLTKLGDSKGNQTVYSYKPGTNLLVKKLIYDEKTIRKRTFQSYNEDSVCIKIIEDDGAEEKESDLYRVTERHIKEIKPNPFSELPEIIEEKTVNLKKQELLLKKYINTYDEQSNLLSCDTYDANGQYLFTEKRTYNAIGQITSQTDAIGRQSFYTYDQVGNQISYTHQNAQINTLYDFHNKPIQITEIYPEEQFSLYNSYDSLGRKISSTDRFGNSTHYEYDAFHRLTKVIHPQVYDENEQITSPTFRYTYDIFGNVLTITDPKGFVIKKSYNLRGDPTKIIYPDGTFELFKYDTEGSLHRSLTREQIITVYEYDYLGRPIYEESSTGTPSFLISRSYQYNGFRCTYEKEDDYIKRYAFDFAGRLVAITEYSSGETEKSPNTRRAEFSYNSQGRIDQKKVWFDTGPQDFSIECLTYDLFGNPLEKRIEDAQGKILLQKHYNTQNQCTEENGIKTTYNSQGEPVSYIDTIGNETKVHLDKMQNTLGQTVLKKIIINPLGIQTEIEFDALGRIVSLSKKDPFGLLLSSQKSIYDSCGNRSLEIHDQIIEGEIKATQKNQWIYGPMGRLEKEIQAADSLAKETHYTYNSLGKLVVKKIAGTEIHYTYNKDGNLHKIEAPKISNRYSYDRRGHITSAYSLHGKSVLRNYNVFGQITKETVKDGEGNYTLEYTYDRKGRLKEITLPDQSKITYAYDAVFGKAVNRFSPQAELLYTHTYETYDTQGKLLRENAIGYIGSIEYHYQNEQKIAIKSDLTNQEYTRDPLGRITKGEKNYTYNSLSQLTSENEKTYLYDSLDNRIKSDNDTLIYNSLNQLTSYANTEFSYDPQGNLLRKILDGEETHFENNSLSQLISLEKDGQKTTFSYDPFGRLLVEKNKNKKTRYLYLGSQEIGTLSPTGTIETLKVLGLNGDELAPKSIAFEINNTTYAPLHDLSGNVTHLIDPLNRQIVESYKYTAFGEEQEHNFCNPWRFAEKRHHEGLLLFGLRFYDPQIGRWISQDPAGTIDGPNLYTYLHNNPLNHIDPLGLNTESPENKLEGYFYGEVEVHCYCEKHRTCKRGGDLWITAGPQLPKISYCDSFENYYKDYRSEELFIPDLYEESTSYELNFPHLPDDLGIGFINGVGNNFPMSRNSALYLSKLSGGYNIHGVYNATHGSVDLFEYGLGLNYIATEPVRQLHKMWNSFFEKSSAKARFLMICHSQGTVHVRNALLDYPKELRERILVVAIAPGAYIYRETCLDVFHYRAEWWRDFIPRIDLRGARREKDTIITLSSHPNAPIFDHDFMSPTYQKKLKEHIDNYINSKGGAL